MAQRKARKPAARALMKRVGRAVAHYRAERGWSQETLGREAGPTRQTIYEIEKGDRQSVPAETLADIADALGVELMDLLTFESTEPLPPAVGDDNP